MKYLLLLLLFLSCNSEKEEIFFEDYSAKINAYYSIISYEYETKKTDDDPILKNYKLDSTFISEKVFKIKNPFFLQTVINGRGVNSYQSDFSYDTFVQFIDQNSTQIISKTIYNKALNTKVYIYYLELEKGISVNNKFYKFYLDINLHSENSSDGVSGKFLIE